MDSCEKLFVGGYGHFETEQDLLNNMYNDSDVRSNNQNIETVFVNPSEPDAKTDLTFVVGPSTSVKVEFQVHKAVLSEASGVFKTMIEGALSKVKGVKRVALEDTEASSFSDFLAYIYRKELTLDDDNVLDLLHLSHKYMMKQLLDSCFEYLVEHVSIENFFTVLEIILFYNDLDSKDRLLIYFRNNAQELLNHSSLVTAPRLVLLKLLHLECVNVREIEFLKACLRWAKYRLNKKKVEFGMTKDIYDEMCGKSGDKKFVFTMNVRDILGEEIVRNIRFPTMSKQEFQEIMRLTPILSQTEITRINRAIATEKWDEELHFSMKPRQTFREICVDRTDTMKKEESQILGVDSLYFTTKARVFLTGVGVIKKKNSSAVSVTISKLSSDKKSRKFLGMTGKILKNDTFTPVKVELKKCLILEPNHLYELELNFIEHDPNSRSKYRCREADGRDGKMGCAPHQKVVFSRMEKFLTFEQPDFDALYYNVPHVYYLHF